MPKAAKKLPFKKFARARKYNTIIIKTSTARKIILSDIFRLILTSRIQRNRGFLSIYEIGLSRYLPACIIQTT